MVLFGGVNLKTPGVSDTSQTFDAYPRDTWELTPATLAGPYATAFAGEFGYACALGLFLFVFILGLTWINNKFVKVDK
jgi:hypothetical protein